MSVGRHEGALFLVPFALGLLGLGCKAKDPAPTSTATSGAASMSSPTTPDAGATALTVFRHVRLVDGSGAPAIEDAVMVVRGERILATGPAASTPAPLGATVVDLGGATIVPGLISDHSHLGLTDGTASGAGHWTEANVTRQLVQYEAFGVTTVMSLGMNAPLATSLTERAHAGKVDGADFFSADRGIGITDAAPPVDVGVDQLYRVTNAQEGRAAVLSTARVHPLLLKIWVDDFHGKTEPKMSPEIFEAIIDEAHKHNLRVASHVFYLDDAKKLVAAGVDILAHGIRDRAVDAELIDAMKARGTWYVPTLGLDETFYVFARGAPFMTKPVFTHAVQPALAAQFADAEWKKKTLADAKAIKQDEDAVKVNAANFKSLHDAGIHIGFGTDSGASPLRIAGFAEHHELHLMVDAGVTPLEALHLATANAAALLGLKDRGTIAPGLLADFVVVEGKPDASIDDLDHIVSVWHSGKKVSTGMDAFTP